MLLYTQFQLKINKINKTRYCYLMNDFLFNLKIYQQIQRDFAGTGDQVQEQSDQVNMVNRVQRNRPQGCAKQYRCAKQCLNRELQPSIVQVSVLPLIGYTFQGKLTNPSLRSKNFVPKYSNYPDFFLILTKLCISSISISLLF